MSGKEASLTSLVTMSLTLPSSRKNMSGMDSARGLGKISGKRGSPAAKARAWRSTAAS
jgi:hypothetical protein